MLSESVQRAFFYINIENYVKLCYNLKWYFTYMNKYIRDFFNSLILKNHEKYYVTCKKIADTTERRIAK
jgi:hypothetical protein